MAQVETGTLSIGAAIRASTAALRSAGFDTPSLDARLLVAHILGTDHDRLLSIEDAPLPGDAQRQLAAALRRRLDLEPVSRILGYREFWSRKFEITQATLDPRPETETLIETALAILARERNASPRLLDIGTGTGCILLTLLAELPRATGVATDIHQAALDVARRNAAHIGVVDRVEFRQTDVLDTISGPFDLLLSNPPYIPSGDIASLAPEVAGHDPRAALDGGPDGLAMYRRIVAGAHRVVRGGWVVLEVGCGQARAVVELARSTGGIVEGTPATHMDMAGIERCVAWKTHT